MNSFHLCTLIFKFESLYIDRPGKPEQLESSKSKKLDALEFSPGVQFKKKKPSEMALKSNYGSHDEEKASCQDLTNHMKYSNMKGRGGKGGWMVGAKILRQTGKKEVPGKKG